MNNWKQLLGLFRLDIDDISMIMILGLYAVFLFVPLRKHVNPESVPTAAFYMGVSLAYGFVLIELFPNRFIAIHLMSAQLTWGIVFLVIPALRWLRLFFIEKRLQGLGEQLFTTRGK